MPEHLRRGDVVNLKQEYAKYAFSGGKHFGEDILGTSWVVEDIDRPELDLGRLISLKAFEKDGERLEMINGPSIPEYALVKNEFLTAAYRATSESRREE